MLGYRNYINISDGQHSVQIVGVSTITIKAKDGTRTVVNTSNVDFGKSRTNYHGQFVPCIVGHKTTRNRKLIEQERYGVVGKGFFKGKDIYIPYADKTWNGRHGEMVRRTTLYGEKGICRTRYSRGRLLGQRFIYSNRATAYCFSNKDSDCTVKRPNGKIRYEYKSAIPIVVGIRKSEHWGRKTEREGYPFFEIKRDVIADCSFTGYDRKGRVKERGEYKNRQQVGEWVVGYKEQHFINGLMVDKKMYYADPATLDARKVLQHPNAQFRAMLLKKIGLERIVKECKGKLIDEDKKNDYALYDFSVKSDDKDEIERKLRVLKLTCPSTKIRYFLRIPADAHFDTCYKARQGTFNGFDIDAKPIKFALET